MEIESGGAVSVYDGPAIVTSAGVTPIHPVRARAERSFHAPRRLTASSPPRLTSAISDAAVASNLSASLIAAVAWRESNYRASAVSRAGALGEMQLLPETARELGVDPRDSRQNVAGGAAYLRSLLRRYDGDLVKTLAAYNAGPRAVDRYGGPPPYKETQAYVAAVLERLSQDSLDEPDLRQRDIGQTGGPASTGGGRQADLMVVGGLGR